MAKEILIFGDIQIKNINSTAIKVLFSRKYRYQTRISI